MRAPDRAPCRWTLTYERESGILCHAIHGTVDRGAWERIMRAGATAARHYSAHLFLIDYGSADVQLTVADLYDRASLLDTNGMPRSSHYAIVYAPEFLAANGEFAENAAVNRGFAVRTFSSVADARAWLLNRGRKAPHS